ncbi:MAG: hypothetical protein ACJ8F7_19985, partial [Gemmataceae bacterium]
MNTGAANIGKHIGLILILMVPLAAAGQQRIPPPGVPETEEPPRANPNQLPKGVPPDATPLPRPVSPYGMRQVTPAAPESNDPPTPVVTIRVRAPATMAVGAADVKITVIVENVSQANAYHVRVAYPKPANAEINQTDPPADTKESTASVLKWHFDELKPNEKKVITLTFTPKDENDVKHVARVSFEHGEQVVIKQNRPDIQTQRVAPTHWHEGEEVPVKLIIENKGKAEARDVLVSDVLDDGLEHVKGESKTKRFWNFDSLKPGEKREVTYTVRAGKTGTFADNVFVSASKVPEQKKTLTVIVGRPLLELRVAGPEQVYVSQSAVYEITARNSGDVPLDNVAVVFQYKDLKIVTATQGASQFKDRLQWVIARFTPGMERRFSVKVQATAAGDAVNIVEILARNTTKREQKVTKFVGAAALELRARADANPIGVHDRVTYTVTVRNAGTPTAEDVRLTCTFPLEQ